MRQVRRNIFESNSSSSHSLVIVKDEILNQTKETYGEDQYCTSEEIKDRMSWSCNFMSWEFGRWPFRVLKDFWGKFAYAYANGYAKEELLEILKEVCPDCGIPTFSEDAYVDDANLKKWLERGKISLKDFLINKKYIVICDGDEYCIWDSMLARKIVDIDAIEENYGCDIFYEFKYGGGIDNE